MNSGRGFISLPVTVVVLAIVYIYVTTVFVYLDRWLGLATSQGIMNAVAFTTVAFMCVYTYALAVLKDPGRVPSNYIHEIEDSHTPIQEIKRKSGDLRYCQKCSHYKPPRAHHCRTCKRCVLRMDHHCIWINNCVGHANYKFFFIFVLYAVIACLYSLVLLFGSLTVDPPKDEQQSGSSTRSIYVVSGLLVVPVSVALGFLLGWHVYLTFQNKTTIEYHEGVRAMWLAEKGGTVYRHPYNVGIYENLTTVRTLLIFFVFWYIRFWVFIPMLKMYVYSNFHPPFSLRALPLSLLHHTLSDLILACFDYLSFFHYITKVVSQLKMLAIISLLHIRNHMLGDNWVLIGLCCCVSYCGVTS